jgi:hypothetical protein
VIFGTGRGSGGCSEKREFQEVSSLLKSIMKHESLPDELYFGHFVLQDDQNIVEKPAALKWAAGLSRTFQSDDYAVVLDPMKRDIGALFLQGGANGRIEDLGTSVFNFVERSGTSKQTGEKPSRGWSRQSRQHSGLVNFVSVTVAVLSQG